MLVDCRRAAVRSGLPHAKDRALGIGEHARPPRVKHVEGLGEHPPARLAHPGRGVVGGLDADVGVPHRLRRRTGGLRGDRGRVPAVDAGHVVVSSRVGGHRVLGLPPEEPGVEPGGACGVGLAGVDPARHPGWVILARAHDGSLQRLSSSIPAASRQSWTARMSSRHRMASLTCGTRSRMTAASHADHAIVSASRKRIVLRAPTDSGARVLRTTSVVSCWRQCWPPWWRR